MGVVLVKVTHANLNVELLLIVKDQLVVQHLVGNANARIFYVNLKRNMNVKKSRNVGAKGFVVRMSLVNVSMMCVQSHGGTMEKIKMKTAEIIRIVR